jgi:hypothetical protein
LVVGRAKEVRNILAFPGPSTQLGKLLLRFPQAPTCDKHGVLEQAHYRRRLRNRTIGHAHTNCENQYRA